MHNEELTAKIPLIMDAISNFFTPMLSTMYAVQINLYQHIYASVHEYATSQGLTSTDNVVEEFESRFEPKRLEIEGSVKSLREGKIAKTPYGEGNSGKPGLFSRKSSASVPTVKPTPSRTATATSPPPPPYAPQDTRKPSISSYKSPPPPPSAASLTPSRNTGSGVEDPSLSYSATRASSSSSVASDAAKKRAPPPPPPPKPSVSPKPEFVTAIYDFAGQSAGDLSFRTGDRIKIVKKTDSLEDWWQGELNGTRGSFPRNYCE